MDDSRTVAGHDETPSAIPGLIADPCLTIVDGHYYLYGTTDGHAEWGATSFQAFTSRDLRHWRALGEILVLGRDVKWANSRAWAPAMVQRDGLFYFYFTADESIGVAVGDNPAGPFVDIGRPLVLPGSFAGAAIDPSVFVDHDGTTFLSWGNSAFHTVPLRDSMTAFRAEDVVTITPPGFREAGWIHRHESTYYLSWSENDTREADYRALRDGPDASRAMGGSGSPAREGAGARNSRHRAPLDRPIARQ